MVKKETEIRTEKLSQGNKQTSAEKSSNNLNSNLMNTTRENFKKAKKESKQLTLEDTGFKLLTKSRGLETETQTEKLSKALGFGSEACKESKKSSKNLQSSLTPGILVFYLVFYINGYIFANISQIYLADKNKLHLIRKLVHISILNSRCLVGSTDQAYSSGF